MDSLRVMVTHQSVRTQSYKSSPINFPQDFPSESSPLQVENTTALFDKNGRDWKHKDDSSAQGNLEIPSILENNNYCRVSAREIECESQLGVQEFSGFQQLSVVSQSVSNDKSKLGYL